MKKTPSQYTASRVWLGRLIEHGTRMLVLAIAFSILLLATCNALAYLFAHPRPSQSFGFGVKALIVFSVGYTAFIVWTLFFAPAHVLGIRLRHYWAGQRFQRNLTLWQQRFAHLVAEPSVEPSTELSPNSGTVRRLQRELNLNEYGVTRAVRYLRQGYGEDYVRRLFGYEEHRNVA